MHEEDFCCSVCLDIFIEPQVIQCGHTFCRICIEETLNVTNNCPICRSKAGKIIPNRQLESVTLRWMQDTGRGMEYVQKKETNRMKISLRNRALVILWTALSAKADKKMRLAEFLESQHLEFALHSEVMRQISMQRNIGLKVEEHESGDLLIQLIE